MVLFPIAVVWIILVIVWVVRNEVKPEQDQPRRWVRRRPRPPRDPRGRPNGSGGRRGDARAARGEAREPR